MKQFLAKILVLLAMIVVGMNALSQTPQIEIDDSLPSAVSSVLYGVNHFVEDLDKAQDVQSFNNVLGAFGAYFETYHDETPIDEETRQLFTKANRNIITSVITNMMRVTGKEVSPSELNVAIDKTVSELDNRLARCKTVGEYTSNALLF